MIKKPKKAAAGVPEWIVTFGDLMSLLLTFFILLQMFSEPKRDREYQRVVTAIKEAFGYSGGIGVLPTDDIPLRSLIEQLEHLAIRNFDDPQISQNDTPGLDGPHLRVTRVREGIVFTLGGAESFDPCSAEIKPGVRTRLEQLSVLLAGRRNRIVVRGHAASKYLPPGCPYSDLDELSYQRAAAVLRELVSLGLDDRLLRVEAVGAREPLRPREAPAAGAAENRRVEVILSEQLVEEVVEDPDFTDPDGARGGTHDG
jgi:chemotaxis protein MotB